MNRIAVVLLILHLFIVSCVDAGKVILMDSNITRSFVDLEAAFSPSVNAAAETGVLYVAEPSNACVNLRKKPEQSPNGTSPFVLIVRGGCTFEHKVRNAQRSGFKAAIVHDNVHRGNILIRMEGDPDGTKIQAVFVTKAAGETLKKYAGLAETRVMLVSDSELSSFMTISLILSLAAFVVVATCGFVCWRCTTQRNATSQLHGMSRRVVRAMPSVTFTSVHGDSTTALTCAICLEDYTVGNKLRVLPCDHKYHAVCIDSWLTSWRTFCPVCKRDAGTSRDDPPASETTPLLGSSHHRSSYIQQPFRSSSHHSSIIVHSPSLRSYTGLLDHITSQHHGHATVSS